MLLHEDGSVCEHEFKALEAEPPMEAVQPEADIPWLYEGLWCEGRLVRKSWVIHTQNPPHVLDLLARAKSWPSIPFLPWGRAELIGENAPPYPVGMSVYFACPPPGALLSIFGAPSPSEVQWWDHWAIKLPKGGAPQLKLYDVGARAEQCWPDLPASAELIYGISKLYGDNDDDWGVYFETRDIKELIRWSLKNSLALPATVATLGLPPWNFAVQYHPASLKIRSLKHFHFVNQLRE